MLAFDVEDADAAAAHDPATNLRRITIPSGNAKARLTAQVVWAGNSTGVRNLSLQKNSNGVDTLANIVGATYGTAAGASARQVTSSVLEVILGDVFEVFAYQTGGGALNVIGGGPDGEVNWFAAELWAAAARASSLPAATCTREDTSRGSQ